MRPPSADFAVILMSEDVRAEASGRISLMGIYGPTLPIRSVPISLQSLAFTLVIMNPRERLVRVRYSIRGPDGKDVVPEAVAELPTTSAIPAPFMTYHTIKVFPMPIQAVGDYEFVCYLDEASTVGLKRPFTVVIDPQRHVM